MIVKIKVEPETLFTLTYRGDIVYWYVINVITKRNKVVQIVYIDKEFAVKVLSLKDFLESLTKWSDTGEFNMQDGVDMIQFNLMME